MKLNIKRLTTLLIFLIIVLNNIFVLSKNYHTNTNNYRKINQPEKATNTRNPYFSYIVGFVESLGGNNIGWYECLPKEWLKKSNDNFQQTDPINKKFNNWFPLLKTINKETKPVVTELCSQKKYVIEIFKAILGKESTPSFIEGKIQRLKRFRNKIDFKVWVKETSKSVWDKLKSKMSEVWTKIKLTEPLKNALMQLGTTFVDLKKKLFHFFKLPMLQTIHTILNCIKNAKKFSIPIINTFEGFFNKIQKLTTTNSHKSFLVISVLSDIVLGLICSREDFKTTHNLFLEANDKSDKVEKWYSYGQGFAKIIKTIGNRQAIKKN
jgi:hypothetical protein